MQHHGSNLVIVGAGVAGLAAARALRVGAPGARVTILERSGKAGGLVETERTREGLVLEHGPDCLVTTKPEGVQTLKSLRIGDAVVPGATKQSFVASGNRLIPLPKGLFAPSWAAASQILTSPLFSAPAKARILMEPLIGKRHGTEDESVASFVRRRFGAEFLERAIGPLMTLIHGTPIDRLSLHAALPRLAELERQHGSISWGLSRSKRKQGPAAKSAPALAPMISFRRGMSTLTDAMARSLDGAIRLGVDVRAIERRAGGGFRLTTAAHGTLEADGVIVAVPAFVAGRLLEGLDDELPAMLDAVQHSRLDTVTLAFRRGDIPHAMDGTGFVVVDASPRAITGCSWMTESWPDRAPDGIATLRCFASNADASDQELVDAVRRDLRDLMGIEAAPMTTHLRRRDRVLPQYEVGCMARIEAIRSRAGAMGAFALAGNAHGGVGIPDCIRSGELAARHLASQLAS